MTGRERMRGTLTGLIGAGLCAAAAALPGGAAAQAPPPSDLRVYVVVLDGLRPSEVGALTPNIAALRAAGTWYEQARAVFPAETLPNHVAMMTGVLPQRSGIIGNDFWQQGASATKVRMAHPKLLGAETLVTRLEDRCTVTTAQFMSKGYLWGVLRGEPPKDPIPPANYSNITPDNADHPGSQREADYHFKPAGRAGYLPDPDDHALDSMVMKSPPSIDYTKGGSSLELDKGGFLPWLETNPPTPHFAFVNLGDIDRSGHVDVSGVPGGFVSGFRKVALTQTDALVGELVSKLKSTGAWEKTVLIFASDHGMDWSPPVFGDNFATPLFSVEVTTVLNGAQLTGDAHVVPGGGTAAVYLEKQGDVGAAARALVAHPGVSVVATRHAVPGLDQPTLADMGMDHRYNGDIVVMVREGWAIRDGSSANPIPGNHGHPATQQSVLFVSGGHPLLDAQPESVGGPVVYDPERGVPWRHPASGPGNLSIAPTVAALFGVGEPAGGYDGAPLTEAFDAEALAPHPACTAGARASAPVEAPLERHRAVFGDE